MSMEKCEACLKEVSASAMVCPHCGHKLRMGWFAKTLIGAVVLFGAVLLFGAMQPSDPEKARARRSIELCWDRQGKKSLDPDAARFVAGACELMESEFKSKYGVNP